MYMITGDHPRTALSIAKHLHILDDGGKGSVTRYY
jgi:magnesium-transporting ATPase (P-type)